MMKQIGTSIGHHLGGRMVDVMMPAATPTAPPTGAFGIGSSEEQIQRLAERADAMKAAAHGLNAMRWPVRLLAGGAMLFGGLWAVRRIMR